MFMESLLIQHYILNLECYHYRIFPYRSRAQIEAVARIEAGAGGQVFYRGPVTNSGRVPNRSSP